MMIRKSAKHGERNLSMFEPRSSSAAIKAEEASGILQSFSNSERNMLRFLLAAFFLQTALQCQAQSSEGLHPKDILNRHWRLQVRPDDVRFPRSLPSDPIRESDHEPLPPSSPVENESPNPGAVEVDVSGIFPPAEGAEEVPSSGGGFEPMYSGFNFGGMYMPGPLSWMQRPGSRQKIGWWNGSNVCENHDESSTGDFDSNYAGEVHNLTWCQITPHKMECTTNIIQGNYSQTRTVTYTCCPGYHLIKGHKYCVQASTKSLLETVKELNGTRFEEMIVNAGLTKKIQEETLTIFMPTDKALDDYAEKMLNMNQLEQSRDPNAALSSRDLVLNHIVRGMFNVYDIISENTVKSEYMNTSIRMNIFLRKMSKSIYTANCVPIIKSNKLAANGILHVVDGVIMPGVLSIKEIVQGEKNLSILKQIFLNPETVKMLERKTPFTFLAPTDEALKKLSNHTLQKLISGDSSAIEILEHHIIELSVCESVIESSTTLPNLQNKYLEFIRAENNTVYVEGAKVEKSDIIARDGVVHTIDTVLSVNNVQ